MVIGARGPQGRNAVRQVLTAAVITVLAAAAARPVRAQARTTIELGSGIFAMRNSDGWNQPVGLYGQFGVRRPFANALEWRISATAMQRRVDTRAGERIRTIGVTGEVAYEIGPPGIEISGGLGGFVVNTWTEGYDDSYGGTGGSLVFVVGLAKRWNVGTHTLDLRGRVIDGDLGDGTKTITLGLVMSW